MAEMYELRVLGELPNNPKAMLGAITNLTEQCTLHGIDPLFDDRFKGHFHGTLTQAPDGVYELWQESGHVRGGVFTAQLIVHHGRVLVDGQVVTTVRDAWGEREAKVLDGMVLAGFRKLLSGVITKVVLVYENEYEQREYRFGHPEADHPAELDEKPGYKYIGVADLKTGRIG